MPPTIQHMLWAITIDLLKAIIGITVVNYLMLNGPALFDQAFLSLKGTFEQQTEELDVGGSPLVEEATAYPDLHTINDGTVTETPMRALPAFSHYLSDLTPLSETGNGSQEHIENGSCFPPYDPLPAAPVRSGSGASLISIISNTAVGSFAGFASPTIKLPKINLTLVVLALLLLVLAAITVSSRMQDKKHIPSLEKEIKAPKIKISERIDMLQNTDQEHDQRAQKLKSSREDAETRANNVEHSLGTLKTEFETKEEAHDTQLRKLGQDVEKLRNDDEIQFHKTPSKLWTESEEKEKVHEAQVNQLRRDLEEVRKNHEMELGDTKVDLKKQCKNHEDELRRSNATVYQLQIDLQSLRDEIDALKSNQQEILNMLNTKTLDQNATKAELKIRNITLDQLRADLQSLRDELNALKGMQQQTLSSLSTNKANYDAIQAELESRTEELKPNNVTVSQLQIEVQSLRDELHTLSGMQEEKVKSTNSDCENETDAAGDHDDCVSRVSEIGEDSSLAFAPEATNAKSFTYLGDTAYNAMSRNQRRRYNSRRKEHEAEVERSRTESGTPGSGSGVPEPGLNPFVKEFMPGGVHIDFKIMENGLVKSKEPEGARRPEPPRAKDRSQVTSRVARLTTLSQSTFAVNLRPNQPTNSVPQQKSLDQDKLVVNHGLNQPVNDVRQHTSLGESQFAVNHGSRNICAVPQQKGLGDSRFAVD